MAGSSKIHIRRMNGSDLPAIQYLMRTVFQKKYSLEYLAKKYDTRWTGLNHIAHLAFAGTEPVAMYGALPQLFRQGNQSFLGVHTCDSFTLPSYQGQGLHRDLALQSYEVMKAEGVKFVYAYHSEATYHSCKKLGWAEGPTLQGCWLPTGHWGLARFRNKLAPNHIPQSFRQHQLGEIYANSFADTANFHVHYSAPFFQYKQFTPNLSIQLADAQFWVKSGSVLMVGDGHAPNLPALEQGVRDLMALAKRGGYAKILFQVHPQSQLHTAISQLGQLFPSWLVGYLLFDASLQWDNWRGNFGDLDTF